MIPLTTMPSSEDNTPVHYPRRRLVEPNLGYGGSPACSNSPYGHQHHLIVRGSAPRYGPHTTAAAHDYFTAPAVHHEPAEQQPVDVTDWADSCFRVLTCDGLCVGSAAGSERHNKALMVDVVSRVLFPIMFVIFNIIYWPIYLM